MAIEDRGPQVTTVSTLFLALTWSFTILRCYVRIHITKLFRSDDWFALATLVVYTIYCSFVLVGARHGTGRHIQDLSQEEVVSSMKWFYCGEIVYVLTTCLLKIYIGIFLGQIVIKRAQTIVIWTACVVFSAFSVYYLFLLIFQCHPTSYFWMRYVQGSQGSCLSPLLIVHSTYIHGVLSATVDWILGTLPIFIVWNLNLNTRTKVSVAVILALGAVGSIATIIRIPYIHLLSNTTDFLFANTSVSIWSTVEPGMGIVAFSIACLRPLFRSIYHHSTRLGSVPTANSPGNTSRSRYVSSKIQSHNRLEELAVPSNFAHAIHVETVIDTYSAKNMSRDLEFGMGGSSQQGSSITSEMAGERGWSESLASENTFEMSPVTPSAKV